MKEINTYNEDFDGNLLPESLRANPFAVPEDYFDTQESQILSIIRLTTNKLAEDNESTVPKGYFDQLQASILAKVAEQKLKEKVSDLSFEVPLHYFEESASQIQSKIVELKLREQIGTTGFVVPENYFENTEGIILARTAEQRLKSMVETDGFTVPQNYFIELEENIQFNSVVEKLKTEVADTGFAIPQNYFETLSQNIFTSIGKDEAHTEEVTREEKPVILLNRNKSWLRYASIAAVATLIGFGSYFSYNMENHEPTNNQVTLSQIPDEAIVSYLTQVSDGDDILFISEYLEVPEKIEVGNQVDDDDIKEYLNYML